MKIGRRHWAIALLAAVLLQLALAAALYRPSAYRGTGLSTGVEIELGPSLAGAGGNELSPSITEIAEASPPESMVPPTAENGPLTDPEFEETTTAQKTEPLPATAPVEPPPESNAPATASPSAPAGEQSTADNGSDAEPPTKMVRHRPNRHPLPAARQAAPEPSKLKTETAAAKGTTSGSEQDKGNSMAAAGAAESLDSGGAAAAATTLSADYHHRLAAWLEKHKYYPRRALQRRLQGVVRVSFKIDRQGNLLSRRIVASSGYRLLDEAADELLLRASPMPGIPRQLTAQMLEFTLPIKYALN